MGHFRTCISSKRQLLSLVVVVGVDGVEEEVIDSMDVSLIILCCQILTRLGNRKENSRFLYTYIRGSKFLGQP